LSSNGIIFVLNNSKILYFHFVVDDNPRIWNTQAYVLMNS